METTLSSCSNSEAQQMQQIQDKAKKSCMNSIDERVQLKREYDSWVNERQMQTTEEKVDTSQALDASSIDTESNIRPIYDEEPMAEVQTTAEIDVFAIGQQHTDQPEFNNEGGVVHNAEECHDKCPLLLY
nr:hypothetical protein [Tanacetum cinerariifolium]